MITSRRDYILRMIDEIGRILARLSLKRREGESDESALESIMLGFERLFQLDADQIFLLTPDQHFAMLTDDDDQNFARDKVLLYAALSAEAGHVYAKKGNQAMARATFLNALRFTLRAHAKFSAEGLPDYSPRVSDLLTLLAGTPLDVEITELLRASGNSAASR
jgi:hypothetical protein